MFLSAVIGMIIGSVSHAYFQQKEREKWENRKFSEYYRQRGEHWQAEQITCNLTSKKHTAANTLCHSMAMQEYLNDLIAYRDKLKSISSKFPD
jgi:hypothetical protein